MAYQFDQDNIVQKRSCPRCRGEFTQITHFIYKDHAPYAVSYIACHLHNLEPELFIDVIFGTWDKETYDDHVTFSSRYAHDDEHDEFICALLDAGPRYPDTLLVGHKLTRDEAAKHPQLEAYWSVVDFIIAHDPLIHEYLAHSGLQKSL